MLYTDYALNPFAPAWWKTAVQAWEIAIAAPFVATTRIGRLVAAGPLPNASDRREFIGMGLEKWQAFGESMTRMAAESWRLNLDLSMHAARQLSALWGWAWFPFGARIPGTVVPVRAAVAGSKRIADSMAKVARSGLGPIHKRATGNAKRLRRLKKR